jgi:dTDP-4-amino-4,6-dideoxygalactose transaminase
MIPFSPPRIDQKIIDAVTEALKSGWITTGPKTKEFERQISTYCGVQKTVCVNAWTNGMEVMLRWLGIQEGDEVILPAYTYCASANIVLHCGATPILVDINEKDFNVSLGAIKKAITSRTKAIMGVDISGYPCDYDAMYELVNESKVLAQFIPSNEVQKKLGRIAVLSDAAHSFGARYKNKKAGALADISVFSFHAVKNLSTAEGGAICLNLPKPFDNEEIYKEICIKILHGQSKDALAKTQKGNWQYDVLEPGYKCNMTDIQAAIGLVELQRYDQEYLERRKKIFKLYDSAFVGEKWAILPEYISAVRESSYHLYLLRIKNATETQRNEIMKHIFDADVSVNVHFQPLPLLTAYKQLGYKMADYPNAWEAYQNEITLPVYFDLTNENVENIAQAVKLAVAKVLF